MTSLTINGNEYKIKYGYNCFADTDLLDKVEEISLLVNGANNDSDVQQMGKIKDLFLIVRELLFVGFQKYNPVENVQAVGDLLDDYYDEAPEGEDRGLLSLFAFLSNELADEGFLADLMEKMVENQNEVKSIPQDHKKKSTKTTK